MRKIYCSFLILIATAAPSAAQTPSPRPRFDTAFTAGLMSARMPEIDEPYYQNWYEQGRYAGSIGYYFTKNLKAEFEHAWSGEGSRQIFSYAPADGRPYPFPVEQSFQLQQSTLRLVYQFRDNAWVHPYLSAGAVLDIERRQQTTTQTELRGGVSTGGGAKFYMSPRAFFNAATVVTISKPSATVNFIAGFGFDW